MASPAPLLPGAAVLAPMEAPATVTNRRGKGNPYAYALLAAFVDHSMRHLSGSEVAVWLTLYRDARDGLAHTAVAELARRTGYCRRQVVNALGTLAKAGLLDRVRRGNLIRGTSVYRVRGPPIR